MGFYFVPGAARGISRNEDIPPDMGIIFAGDVSDGNTGREKCFIIDEYPHQVTI
jgi:hypothetical protein